MSIHMAFWKESMINQLSKLINRNRSAAKISQVLCSNDDAYDAYDDDDDDDAKCHEMTNVNVNI